MYIDEVRVKRSREIDEYRFGFPEHLALGARAVQRPPGTGAASALYCEDYFRLQKRPPGQLDRRAALERGTHTLRLPKCLNSGGPGNTSYGMAGPQRLVVGRIREQRFAWLLAAVEQEPMAEVTGVAGLPWCVAGVLDVHGDILAVVDPRHQLGLPAGRLDLTST